MNNYSWDRAHVSKVKRNGKLVDKNKKPNYPPIRDHNGKFTNIK